MSRSYFEMTAEKSADLNDHVRCKYCRKSKLGRDVNGKCLLFVLKHSSLEVELAQGDGAVRMGSPLEVGKDSESRISSF